jgi:hypothetical protein
MKSARLARALRESGIGRLRELHADCAAGTRDRFTRFRDVADYAVAVARCERLQHATELLTGEAWFAILNLDTACEHCSIATERREPAKGRVFEEANIHE